MKPVKVFLLVTFVGCFGAAHALPNDGVRDRKAVARFVQAFYDWYTPKASSETLNDLAYYVAIQEKGGLFDPRLVKALRLDHDAWKHAKDDPEGIDFDPFMNSQDPDPRYRVGKIWQKNGAYFVALHRVPAETRRPGHIAVVAKVERYRAGWRFSNFIAPNFEWDLLTLLKELAAARRKR